MCFSAYRFNRSGVMKLTLSLELCDPWPCSVMCLYLDVPPPHPPPFPVLWGYRKEAEAALLGTGGFSGPSQEFIGMNPPRLPGLTCHRISTEVVVWGVTDRMVGASSGAVERGRGVGSGAQSVSTAQKHTGTRFCWHWLARQVLLKLPWRPTHPISSQQTARVSWRPDLSPNLGS